LPWPQNAHFALILKGGSLKKNHQKNSQRKILRLISFFLAFFSLQEAIFQAFEDV
jgi:hypothetical protein